MRISAKQRLLKLAAGSIFAAGAVFIPAAVASAEGEDGRAGVKAPPELPNIPTDPVEDLPVAIPGGGD